MSQRTKGRPRGLSTWTATERFWRNVDTAGDCWLWTGATLTNGYGVITRQGKRVYAHRFSYELHNGPAWPGEVICHTCDVRNCVRPDHLFAGSIADNNRDMWSKGRGRGLDPHNGKLTVEQRRRAVARVAAGESRTAVASDLGVTRQAITYLIRSGLYA